MMRIREVKRDLAIGKIYKNDDQTLKQMGIKTQTALAVQILEKEEQLQENDIQLFVKKRNVKEKTYEICHELIFKASKEPTIQELKQQISDQFQLVTEFTLGKYIQHDFKWIPMTEDYLKKENSKSKTKSKKKQKLKFNLRKPPFLLKDGEIICFRLEEENPNNDDNFQTPEDEQLREIKKTRKKTNFYYNNSEKIHRKEGVGFKIFTKDF